MCIRFNCLIKEKEENNSALYGHTKASSHSAFSTLPSLVFAWGSFHSILFVPSLFVCFVSVLFAPSLDSQALCCPSMFMPVSSSASFPRVWHPAITGEADRDPVSFSGTCLGSCGHWAPSVPSAPSQSPEAGCTEGALTLYSNVAFLGWDPVRPYALGLVFQFWSYPFFSNCFGTLLETSALVFMSCPDLCLMPYSRLHWCPALCRENYMTFSPFVHPLTSTSISVLDF